MRRRTHFSSLVFVFLLSALEEEAVLGGLAGILLGVPEAFGLVHGLHFRYRL